MCLENLHRSFVLLLLGRAGRPDVRFPIFTATDDISSIVTEAGMYLTASIFVPSELHLQALVSQVVQSDAGVIAGYEQLDISIRISGWEVHCLYASDFAPFSIPSVRRSHMDLGVILQTFRFIERAHSVETSRNGRFPVWRKGNCSDQIWQLVPECHTLVGDAPQAKL